MYLISKVVQKANLKYRFFPELNTKTFLLYFEKTVTEYLHIPGNLDLAYTTHRYMFVGRDGQKADKWKVHFRMSGSDEHCRKT